jgi:hypothetical protein
VAWLSTLGDDDEVGIDDGGLEIRAWNGLDGLTGATFELGGIPEELETE